MLNMNRVIVLTLLNVFSLCHVFSPVYDIAV